ncbi:MAG: hypothetical protein PHX34_03595 [Candidatus Shapirobacteria bacterium]|nr:hypothetical protein [Candidatus Shapirobacteria bacterium]
MKTNQIIAVLVLLVVFSGASFFAGTKYQQKKLTAGFSQQMAGSNRLNTGRGAGNNTNTNTNIDTAKNRGQTPGFRQTVGEIISLDDTSITVKMVDGSSKIVLISDSTSVNQSVTASKADLKIGLQVAVMGDQNTDGSVTGQSIEINPHIATVTPIAQQ